MKIVPYSIFKSFIGCFSSARSSAACSKIKSLQERMWNDANRKPPWNLEKYKKQRSKSSISNYKPKSRNYFLDSFTKSLMFCNLFLGKWNRNYGTLEIICCANVIASLEYGWSRKIKEKWFVKYTGTNMERVKILTQGNWGNLAYMLC